MTPRLTGLAAAILIAMAASTGRAEPQTRDIAFDVIRAGDRIGTHLVRLTTEGTRTKAEIEIDLAVSIAFITVYRYTHRNTEIWENGQLLSLTSATDDNGDRYYVRAHREGEGLRIESTAFDGVVPGPLVPTSYWADVFVRQPRLLNSQTGALLPVTIAPAGEEDILAGGRSVRATRYVVDGDLRKEIWYDAQGEWVKTRFEIGGTPVEYERVVPAVRVHAAQG